MFPEPAQDIHTFLSSALKIFTLTVAGHWGKLGWNPMSKVFLKGAIAMTAARKRKRRLLRPPASLLRQYWQGLAIAALAAAALVLGFQGLTLYYFRTDPRDVHTILDRCYDDVQLFFLNSSGIHGRAVNWQLQVARLLAPLAAAWTILLAAARLFEEQFLLLRLRLLRGHVVICGLGRKGAQLVRDFRALGHRVVVIEANRENVNIRECQELGARILAGNASDVLLLRRARADRAARVIATCHDDSTNLEIATLIQHLAGAPAAQAPAELQCMIHLTHLKLCEVLKRHPLFNQAGGRVVPTIFNVYENSARLLFATHPLDQGGIAPGSPDHPHLIVAGFGQMGKCIALKAAQNAHYANGRRLRLTVIDHQAAERKRFFLWRYPQFEKTCDALFLEEEIDNPALLERIRQWTAENPARTRIAICLDDDWRSLMAGLEIQSKLKHAPLPVFVRMADETPLRDLLEISNSRAADHPRIEPFGATCQVCRCEELIDRELELLARTIHEKYVQDRRKRGRKETDSTLRPWSQLHPTLRDAKFQQAEHIRVKLRAIGCELAAPADGREEVIAFAPDEVEVLARMEHARWRAERWLDGWLPGSRDRKAKTTPFLIEWEELPEQIREYKRETVRDIPDLVARANKAIRRTPRVEGD
jgi:hypothetical protein